MKIGFLNNQIDNRGTGNALFDYAKYNKTILGNESYIFSLDKVPRHQNMEIRLLEEFGEINPVSPNLDVIYHIKYGNNDGIIFPGTKYVVHAVFDSSQPHGDRYAAISKWLGDRNKVPYVPHIVDLPNISSNFRHGYHIPEYATVLGRHGGRDTFDIPFVWSAINKVQDIREDIWFVFLNTDKPDIEFKYPERIIFIDETISPLVKRSFINTCDGMLHARKRGETFGIAVGEFAICGKPVITYGNSAEQAHYEYLGFAATKYHSEDDLIEVLRHFYPITSNNLTEYHTFTPSRVMLKFKGVFLD